MNARFERDAGRSHLESAIRLLETGDFGLAVVSAQCQLESSLAALAAHWTARRPAMLHACGPMTEAYVRVEIASNRLELRRHLEQHEAFVRSAHRVTRNQALDSIETVCSIIEGLSTPPGASVRRV